MKHKYNGEYPSSQFNEYKKRIHSLIHWLLIYADEDNPILMSYFAKVQCKLDGLNALLMFPIQIVEIMNLVEAARIEYEKDQCRKDVYRKLILDAHELVDKIQEN